jgi:hypothetical protein
MKKLDDPGEIERFLIGRGSQIGSHDSTTKSQGTEFPVLDDCKILPFVRIEQVKLKS